VPLELLAIDDGSTDDGPALVARLARADARVRPLASGGVGVARATARGLALARGRFVARMDGDDVSLPGRLAAEVLLLEGDPSLGAVGTRVEAFPDSAVGGGLARYVDWQNALLSPEDHARDLFVESPLCQPSTMLRREALLAVGGWREAPWPEDYDLWLRLDAAGWRLAKVSEVLLRWRHREGRLTFTDPGCAPARITEAKAHYLAPRLLADGRPIAIWGAGPTGRRFARALEAHGARASRFVDIDPRKIGHVRRGVAVVSPDALVSGDRIVVAVGAHGARALVRAELGTRGMIEGEDFVCVA
jgi:GT2 family glycosyltransferase